MMSPWRQRFITSRRHPLAFASYLVTFILGGLFAVGVLDTDAFTNLHPFWKIVWEAELVAGGAAGLVMLLVKPRIKPHWPDLADVLRLEAIAAFVGGLGFLTYCVSLSSATHRFSSVDVLLGVMGCGMLVRSAQALYECRYVEQMAELSSAAQALGMMRRGDSQSKE